MLTLITGEFGGRSEELKQKLPNQDVKDVLLCYSWKVFRFLALIDVGRRGKR